MAVDPSPAEALPAETSQAPKRLRLVRITDDDEEEEAAPSLVQRSRNRPDIALITSDRATSDPPCSSHRADVTWGDRGGSGD